MRASSSSLTTLHQAHRNLLKSIAATNQLHCTCSTSITSNRSSSQPSRSTHTTSSNSLTPIPSTSEYNLDFLYPSPRRRLYSTRQGQNGDEEDVSEIPEASTSKLEVAQGTTTRSRKAQEKFLRQRRTRAKKSNLNRMSKIRKQDLLSLISHPLTTENFPIPTRSQAPEMKLLFDHQESIYEVYKKRLDHEHQSSDEKSSSISSASLHFKVARYLLDFAQFIGLNFSRIQLRKAEYLRRRIATILLKDVIPQLERISVRRKEEEEPLVNSSASSGKKRALDSGLKSDDVSSFRIECLKVEALMIEGSELEALTLLDSLLDSQNLIEQAEAGARSLRFFFKSETETQVRDALSSSILTVLSTYKLAAQQPWRERGHGENYTGFFRYKEKRTTQAIHSSPESIANSKGQIRTAERALSWFFSRVELCMFNHHSFPEIHQTVGYLVEKLRYPLGFLENLYGINSNQNIKDEDGEEDSKKRKRVETLHINLTNFTMLLIELDLSLAHQAWKLMHSKGLTLLESATRTLIKAATNSLYQQKVPMIENLHYLALKQSSGSGLELHTYLLLCKHCATFGDQVGLETQLRQLRLYHREQTSTLEDSIYELRCLASSVSGDSDRLIRLLDQRFNLDSILPFKERASFQKSKQGSSKEEPNQKKSIDASKSALLLRCYVKLGDIESAEEIYDNMKSLNLKISSSTYDSLLSGYSRKVNVPAALSLVDEMRSGGIKLSYTSYHHLIRLFALRKDPESAERVIETMRKEGLDIGMRTHIALLNAYVESGSWNLAISHFEFLERRMKGKEYSRLPKQCYVILLKAYILSSSPIQDVMKIFHTLIQDGFQPDSYAFTLLLQSATDAGAMEIAEKIFSLAEDYLARPGKIQMSGERSLGIDQSGNVLSDSFQDDSNSSEVTGAEGSEEAFIPEIDEVDSSSSSLDRYESERVSLPQSRRPILRGQGANVYHFTIMINAYLRLGNAEDAKEYLTEMKKRGIKLTSVTYGSLVASYVKNGTENNAALAKEIISSLRSFEPEASKVASSQVSQSDLDARISLDEKIVQTNSNETTSWDSTDFETLYSPLLQSYAKSGEVSKAQDVLKDMSQIGIKGGIRTLTSFLDANRRAGDVEACMDIWDTIYSRALAETSFDTNIDPVTNASDRDPSRLLDPSKKNLLCLPLSIFMDILQDDDQYKNEIPKIWNQMRKDGFGFDAHNYNSLVRALIKSDRIDSAMRICEDILKDDLFEDAKERKLVELRERKRSREEALSRGEREEEIFDVSEVQEDAEDIEVGNSELDEFEKTPIRQISWRSIPSNRSTQEEDERDYVESPSRPPNRRSQNRFKDDLDGIPPLEEIIKLNQETAEISKSDDEVQESGRRNGITRTASSTLTGALKNRSHELSQWFPHFQTLKLLESYLDSLDRGGRTVAIASPNHSSAVSNSNQEQEPKLSLQHLTVSDLHRKYPRTAENLRKHRMKVQAIEERYRADAERDQVRAQKEDWRT